MSASLVGSEMCIRDSVFKGEECRFSILQAPYQRLKPIAFQLATEALDSQLHRDRPSMATNGGVDWERTLCIMRELPGPDRTLLKRIIMNGVWTQTMIAELSG
eukprot:1114779-Alexandrium_andersonii.AAC.1